MLYISLKYDLVFPVTKTQKPYIQKFTIANTKISMGLMIPLIKWNVNELAAAMLIVTHQPTVVQSLRKMAFVSASADGAPIQFKFKRVITWPRATVQQRKKTVSNGHLIYKAKEENNE